MLYPQKLEEKIGFDKIRQKLNDACESSLGHQFVRKVKYSADRNSIEKWLSQTREFVNIIESGELFPNSNYIDISPFLKKAEVENTFLLEEEFFDLILTLKTLDKCLDFFKSHRENYPELVNLTHPILFDDALLWSLDRRFDDRGKLNDHASDLLFEIRKGIETEQRRLRKVLDSLMKRAQKEGYTPDDLSITIRDGRMVIPVLAEHKRRIKGFVHGESATGQTVYLEPSEVLEINNEVKELQYAEKREVIRILTELTDELRPEIENLSGVVQFLGLIDFIRAKARYAMEIGASKPLWKSGKGFDWKGAQHPILLLAHREQKKEVVPLDIFLGDQNRILVISGPNAGGKSVCLKTVGLLQYMFQCGLLVSVDEDSEFGVFSDLFIDIGDEQSIENDLSTYSSHLVNMKHLLARVNKGSLFLIDEFGTGTEPQFGGAIAESILSELKDSKGYGVITTHYGNLKEFADREHGLTNGAMKYDLRQLRPLYQLEVGKPGSSFALEIAKKIGLPKSTIETAKKKVGRKQVSVEQLLGELESQKHDLDNAEKRIKSKEQELDELTTQYADLKRHLEGQEKRIIRKAKEEAGNIVKGANKEIEKVIRQIREKQAEKDTVKTLRKELDDYRDKVKVKQEDIPALKAQPESGPIEAGSYVRVKGQETVGRVKSIKGKDATLEIGALTSIVKLNRLERVTRKAFRQEQQQVVSSGSTMAGKMANFSSKLDIRGYRAEEVIPTLDPFIDEALMLGINEIQILHGKGTGVLRQIVRDHLKNFHAVNEMRDEHADRGGAGITIVNLG